MIKVIRDNSKQFEVICDNCKSKISFNEYDIKDIYTNKHLVNIHEKHIDCPICRKRITEKNKSWKEKSLKEMVQM